MAEGIELALPLLMIEAERILKSEKRPEMLVSIITRRADGRRVVRINNKQFECPSDWREYDAAAIVDGFTKAMLENTGRHDLMRDYIPAQPIEGLE